MVTVVATGFDGYATLALHQASAWVVENQGDHFWDPADNGPDATPPFRLVEIPLDIGAGAGKIPITPPRFFPGGVTVDAAGAFYVGSMELGSIVELVGNTGNVRTINTGLDGIATFAVLSGSAWLVENQADHFWNPTGPNGMTATKPFRLVEVPLELGAAGL